MIKKSIKVNKISYMIVSKLCDMGTTITSLIYNNNIDLLR